MFNTKGIKHFSNLSFESEKYEKQKQLNPIVFMC